MLAAVREEEYTVVHTATAHETCPSSLLTHSFIHVRPKQDPGVDTSFRVIRVSIYHWDKASTSAYLYSAHVLVQFSVSTHMARALLDRLVSGLAFYSFAIFCYLLYLFLSLRSGEFFRKFGEKEKLQYAIGTAGLLT